MQQENARSQDEQAISQVPVLRFPINRDSSRFSTTYSFYEFIDQELREEEERDMLILRIRENIIGSLVDELFDRHMDREVVPFTVKCYQESLRRLLNWYFFPRDPEDTPVDWEEDEPPPPVPVDNWASYSVPAGGYPPKIKFKFKSACSDEEDEEDVDADLPDFSEFSGEANFMPISPQPSIARCRSVSDPGSLDSLAYHSVESEHLSEARGSFTASTTESKDNLKVESSRVRRTQFQVPPDRPSKPKKDFHFWLNPTYFPATRVVPGIRPLPGERVSSKACGRKAPNKFITLRPMRPTLLNSAGVEVRANTF